MQARQSGPDEVAVEGGFGTEEWTDIFEPFLNRRAVAEKASGIKISTV